MTLAYFAYGSNLHLPRFQRRVPSATVRGLARLPGYALRFHKRGADGSAKANAFATGDHADAVQGVVYHMDPVHKPVLDQLEGGYEVQELRVFSGSEALEVFTYIAQPQHLCDGLLPFHWYKAYVHQGARHHGLCADYIEWIKALPARPDPMPEREAEHGEILRQPG